MASRSSNGKPTRPGPSMVLEVFAWREHDTFARCNRAKLEDVLEGLKEKKDVDLEAYPLVQGGKQNAV